MERNRPDVNQTNQHEKGVAKIMDYTAYKLGCELYCFDEKQKAVDFIGDLTNWKLLWSINKKQWIVLKELQR